MTGKKRKPISLTNQLHAALIQLGLDPKDAELDHCPALGLRRVVDVESGTLDPAHDDPRFLIWRSKAAHKEKTTGRRGESKLSKRGGDISEIAKLKRLEEHARDFDERMRRKVEPPLENAFIEEVGEGVAVPFGAKGKRAWPKRSFGQKPKPEKPKLTKVLPRR